MFEPHAAETDTPEARHGVKGGWHRPGVDAAGRLQRGCSRSLWSSGSSSFSPAPEERRSGISPVGKDGVRELPLSEGWVRFLPSLRRGLAWGPLGKLSKAQP